MGLEHHVELSDFAERAAAVGAFPGICELIGPEPVMALLALDHRVGEAGDVAGCLPCPLIHEDGGIYAVHIIAVVYEALPPEALYVVLERGAERAIIPGTGQATIDLRALEYEAAAL